MRCWKTMFYLIILLVGLSHNCFGEDYSLQYYLSKTSGKTNELTKKEKIELLNRMNGMIVHAKMIHMNLIQTIQMGEIEIRYQEGKFWMSKLEEDQATIEMGIQQLNLLKEKPTHLTASIRLFKSLKDLSTNFNAYNNLLSFSTFIGDLAPEMELWTDPVFYKLYLLPLARLKDAGGESYQKERKSIPKGKKP